MPVVEVKYATQQDEHAERGLIEDITDVLVRRLDVPRSAVSVILTPVPSSRWGVDGSPLSDRGI
jgi:4-oxalocrotonate tautomerase family enzyme